MQRFMVLYVGPPTPPDASHEGWPAWFGKLGDRLVDKGSPMANGLALRGDGSTGGAVTRLNGYSIVQSRRPRRGARLGEGPPVPGAGWWLLDRGVPPPVTARPSARHPKLSVGRTYTVPPGTRTMKGATMLGHKNYTQEEIDQAKAALDRQLAAYKGTR
jgi:hypothetical protein